MTEGTETLLWLVVLIVGEDVEGWIFVFVTESCWCDGDWKVETVDTGAHVVD